MFLSLVIPVYNESENLMILYNELSSLLGGGGYRYEIIFVNDGSVDDSLDILSGIQRKDKMVKVLTFDRNRGRGEALFAGFDVAVGSHIVTIDADLQICVDNIPIILKKLERFDIVITHRINRIESDGLLKFISSQIANFIRNKILSENFKDSGSSLCGFKRECIKVLPRWHEFWYFFTASLGSAYGFSVKEIPIRSLPRRFGSSNYNIRNRFLKTSMALLKVSLIKTNIKNRKTF